MHIRTFSMGSMKGNGGGSLSTLEDLEMQLRQERDGSTSDFQAQRMLEDELLVHLGHQGQNMHGVVMSIHVYCTLRERPNVSCYVILSSQ